ncbi:MAG: M15 family metallopeptidase [Oscillospiraceae bacterium]|nr:M15 family metallopeptidase [Oscillospiraceae bacterium]
MKTKAIFIIVFTTALAAALGSLFHGQSLAAFGDTRKTGDEDAPSLEIYGFLREINMSFEEYLDLTKELDAAGIYPHFIKENAPRYEAYQEKNPQISFSEAIAYVNVNLDKEFYSDILDVPNLDSVTMLVNKHYRLPSDWMPENLINVYDSHFLQEEAAVHSLMLRESMIENELRIVFISTYRSYSSAVNTYSYAIDRYGVAFSDLNYARAGHSDHQTGLAIDLLHISPPSTLTGTNFQDTEEFKWLCENAHNFGFILRYPDGHTHITGYKFEPWHWRYVGTDIATAMYEKGIVTYEEFYGRYLASGVLLNVRDIVLERRRIAEAEEEALRVALQEAADEAARIAANQAEEAARAARQAEIRQAQEEAAERERLAGESAAAEDLERAQGAGQDTSVFGARHIVFIIFAFAFFSGGIFLLIILKRQRKSQGQKQR